MYGQCFGHCFKPASNGAREARIDGLSRKVGCVFACRFTLRVAVSGPHTRSKDSSILLGLSSVPYAVFRGLSVSRRG